MSNLLNHAVPGAYRPEDGAALTSAPHPQRRGLMGWLSYLYFRVKHRDLSEASTEAVEIEINPSELS